MCHTMDFLKLSAWLQFWKFRRHSGQKCSCLHHLTACDCICNHQMVILFQNPSCLHLKCCRISCHLELSGMGEACLQLVLSKLWRIQDISSWRMRCWKSTAWGHQESQKFHGPDLSHTAWSWESYKSQLQGTWKPGGTPMQFGKVLSFGTTWKSFSLVDRFTDMLVWPVQESWFESFLLGAGLNFVFDTLHSVAVLTLKNLADLLKVPRNATTLKISRVAWPLIQDKNSHKVSLKASRHRNPLKKLNRLQNFLSNKMGWCRFSDLNCIQSWSTGTIAWNLSWGQRPPGKLSGTKEIRLLTSPLQLTQINHEFNLQLGELMNTCDNSWLQSR